ncbi:metallophosphoesterase [Chryseobacterium sp. Leaf394]|uniref:metallophosphoesterase n=1 Tax=Chryseobacterium sp. Leaf394 TaxID=1736361 RepID=UPI0006FD15E4|nr:metallophosphoesterase [Chryseobacterium sp. Leaf394]KQS94140.1 metallophosphoesterase [Chryseobacterium sp. Leaf394]
MNLSCIKSLKNSRFINGLIILSVLSSCATYKVQKGKELQEIPVSQAKTENDFKLFLIGDAGNANEKQAQHTLNLLKNKLDSADKNSIVIFLGDNIYPLGMPKEGSKEYDSARVKMENQLAVTKNFKGKTLVIPGNHDWYHGLEGLKAQEDFVKNYLNDKKSFLPKNSCPIDDINLTKDIKLIIIDSEWALIDWDKYPGINKGCDIKTKDDFYKEFKDLIVKNQDKRIIVAVHHPIISSGVHAGFNSAKSHLSSFQGKLPVPGVATLINTLRSSSGASMEDLSNNHYAEFAGRIKNIVQDKENVIFVSGHDHNLQYHSDKNIRQIISGAGSKTDPVTIASKKDFSFGGSGFAVLNLRNDQSADVEYFSTKNNQLKSLSNIQVKDAPKEFVNNYPSDLAATFTSAVYTERMTQRGKFYSWLWGNHYRKYYATPINNQVADLSTLNGGYTPFREGGGNQSNSLRLQANDGQEFVMRGVKKNAIRFLNNQGFKKNSFGNELSNTFPERFLMDFYTTSHPFTAFSVNNLADKIDLFHSNPKLYYIPKQKQLGQFNQNYGDEMYMIEERFSSDPKTLASLDNATDIISTADLIKNLQKNSNYTVDQDLYIRARLFDMLIGDWDRHEDQWKWAEYKNGKNVFYKPIPRDHDQAFSNYDGTAFKVIMNIPMIRHMKSFKDEIKNVKWMNMEPYPLDLIILKAASEKQWNAQAKFIQENISDKDIDDAFKNLPKEVQDDTIADIQRKLKVRKKDLGNYATKYSSVLEEKVPIAGTVNKDKFVISKHTDGLITVKQYELNDKSNEEKLVFEKTYNDTLTKEIWVYGLEEDDIYEVTGDGKSKINIRLIGGYNHDVYRVSNGSKVKIYDFKSQKNTYETKGASKHLTNDYEANTYNWKHPKYNFFAGYPNADFNPDDGVILGFVANYTVNNFIRDPFTQKHSLSANLYTATGGFNVGYKGVFKKAIFGWDANVDAYYTTPHFARTFFGLSNDNEFNKEISRNYNRVRISQIRVAPSISKTNWLNLKHQFQLSFEHSEVQRNDDRFIAVSTDVNPEVFNGQQFGGANYTFSFKNSDSKAFPTLGMELILNAGWKTNFANFDQNFVAYQGTLNLFRKIDKNGKFVFANSANAMIINNNNFEFYQAASIGGRNGLRAYRNERFSGKSYFVNSAEVRWDFGRVKNSIVPANMGILVGYDLGRVWNDHEISDTWHQGVGAGFWLGILDMISARLDYFIGSDGGRISGGVGMSF